MFYEFSMLLLIAAFVGAVAVLLRQPLIVAFIAVGIIVGPAWLGLSTAHRETELLATVGISLLLFVVGLRLDLHIIRSLGPVALATGLGQVFFTSVIGYLICLGLGIPPVPALYVAVALTFSSTIIIVKLLSDKREIDSLHGRIAVGFLIVQDLVVILVMIGLTTFGSAAQTGLTEGILLVLGKGLLLLAGLSILMRFVIPRLVRLLARSKELLVLSAIAWAVSLATLGDYLGLSKEVGAFLAGVSLASTPFRESIGSRLVSLRDFLLLFFFVSLGARLDLTQVGGQLGAASLLSLFVLVGNPLIVMVIMGLMGYRKRTGFLAGLTVAQISEFSLILGALGISLGHLDNGTMGLITLVGLITIGLSTYLILYSHPLYEWLAPWLLPFERKAPWRELADDAATPPEAEVVLFGLGRYGSNIAQRLRQRGLTVLGVDFDPRIVAAWHGKGLAVQYGDAEDPEFPATLPLAQARGVICATPQMESNLSLLHALREGGYEGRVVLTAHSNRDARRLKEAGADLVLLPFVDAAERAAEVICAGWEESPALHPVLIYEGGTYVQEDEDSDRL